MTITRLDAGGERMDMQPLDLSALVRTTMEHMKLLAEEKGLPLTCSSDEPVYVFADAMRIKQVLVNLHRQCDQVHAAVRCAARGIGAFHHRSGGRGHRCGRVCFWCECRF